MKVTKLSRIILILGIHVLTSRHVSRATCVPEWLSKPPDPMYALKHSDPTLEWKYKSAGCTVLFAKWGIGQNKVTQAYFTHKEDHTSLKNFTDATLVQWKKPGSLIIKNVSTAHQKTYGCEINFSEGKHLISTAYLRVVNSKPTLSNALPSTQTRKEGEGPITFEIHAESDPRPMIYWRKNDKDLPQNQNYEVFSRILGLNSKNETRVRSTLTIKTIKRDDRAKFTVRVAYGTSGPYIESHMDFDVEYPPTTATFYTNLSSSTAYEGDFIKFTCVSEANPPPKYHIFKDSKPFKVINDGIFILSAVNKSVSGTYECEPRNSIRAGVRLDLNITVLATGKMSMDDDKVTTLWMIILICCICLLVLVLLLILLVVVIRRKRKTKKKRIEGTVKAPVQELQNSQRKLTPTDASNGFHNPGFYPGYKAGDENGNVNIKAE